MELGWGKKKVHKTDIWLHLCVCPIIVTLILLWQIVLLPPMKGETNCKNVWANTNWTKDNRQSFVSKLTRHRNTLQHNHYSKVNQKHINPTTATFSEKNIEQQIAKIDQHTQAKEREWPFSSSHYLTDNWDISQCEPKIWQADECVIIAEAIYESEWKRATEE